MLRIYRRVRELNRKVHLYARRLDSPDHPINKGAENPTEAIFYVILT